LCEGDIGVENAGNNDDIPWHPHSHGSLLFESGHDSGRAVSILQGWMKYTRAVEKAEEETIKRNFFETGT
jgi:hypothetical protein